LLSWDVDQERWHRRIAPERGTAGRRARNRSIAAGLASEPRSRMTGSREGCKTLPAAQRRSVSERGAEAKG
jgi:hypothetical protein